VIARDHVADGWLATHLLVRAVALAAAVVVAVVRPPTSSAAAMSSAGLAGR